MAATCNIDGKWYVCNIRGELVFGDKDYPTETEAVDAAQKINRKHGEIADDGDDVQRV